MTRNPHVRDGRAALALLASLALALLASLALALIAALALALLAALASGCVPALADDTSRVDAPRILAIRAVPAEAAPNQSVTLTALYADRSGTLTTGPLAWTYCTARKPLAELGPVAPACLDAASEDQVAIGTGLAVVGKLPRDACRLFGPNPPPAEPGEPSGRPVDPDPTGGYYQPVVSFRTDAPDLDPTLATVRLACALPDAPPEIGIAFGERYRRNTNPSIAGLTLLVGETRVDVPEDGAGEPPTVAPGASLGIEVAWPACPVDGSCGDGICGDDESAAACADDCFGATPPGCEGAETYVRYDRDSLALQRRREAMSVAWYATGGTLEVSRTGRLGDELPATSTNVIVAPGTAGEFVLWIVLRDERGGLDFQAFRVKVAG